jgi:SPP1 family predicted phage head-tail adaptor
MIAAGSLDRRISIQRMTLAENDFGEMVETWVPLQADLPANVEPVQAWERLQASEIAAGVTTRFTVRWGLDLTPKDRIVYDGRVWDISSAREIGRREGQELTAAARAD